MSEAEDNAEFQFNKQDEDKSTDKSITNSVAEKEPEKVEYEEKEVEEEDELLENSHPLDILSDQEVIELIEEMEGHKVHLELENYMFEEFLKNNDATLLEGFEVIVEKLVAKLHSQLENLNVPSMEGLKKGLKSASRSSLGSIILEGKGPKVSITHKMDMCLKHIEDMQANLTSFINKSKRIKRKLRAELEEFFIREAEIKEARSLFEHSVVNQGLDPLTQRIPAEKFLK